MYIDGSLAMARKEIVLKAMTFIETAYPQFFRTLPDNMINGMTQTWAEMFADTDEKLFRYAVKNYVANDTKGYPPTIGQINEIIRRAQESPISEIEAWEMVRRALRNSCDYESAQKEYDKLPEEVRAPILKPSTLIEWANLDSNILNNTVSASYRRSYLEKRKRIEEQKALPQNVRNLLPINLLE